MYAGRVSTTLPGQATSLWMDTTPETDYPKLSEDLTVDVAVIGGGISGLCTALVLARAGKSVAVLEADRIGTATTGHTTGKVTALQQLTYTTIAAKHGEAGAKAYGEANLAGLKTVGELIEHYGIDCDAEFLTNYTYATSREALGDLKDEADLMKRIGLPASLITEPPLPFKTVGAVALADQLAVHARKLLIGMARAITEEGGRVFEQTRVDGADDATKEKPASVRADGGTITAIDVVIATGAPTIDKGFFFTRNHPYRSYLIAVRLNGELPDGMFISAEDSLHSIMPITVDGTEYLLVGGEGHRASEPGNVKQRYQNLERFAREHFDVLSVDYRWSTQDGKPVDEMPFVGHASPRAKHLWVITGLRKWGLSGGPAGALILKDAILGQPNPWVKFYSPNRIKPLAGASKFLNENMQTGLLYMKQRLQRGGSLADLAVGEGAVIRRDGERVAVYKDDDGELHGVSAVCTHLQCLVEFNDGDKTWDCPCHGSRFGTDGAVLQGPAKQPLAKKDLKA